MTETHVPGSATSGDTAQAPPAGPSGATDALKEREKKFDEEGGDQPQAPSQQAVDEELGKLHDQSQGPNEPLDERGEKQQ